MKVAVSVQTLKRPLSSVLDPHGGFLSVVELNDDD